MAKRSPTLGTLVSTKTKCIKLIFIGKITLVPVAFLMALSIFKAATTFENVGHLLQIFVGPQVQTSFIHALCSNCDIFFK